MELVISAAIGVMVIGSVSVYTLIEFLSNPTQDLNLQLSDEGERATDWIDTEISRASGFDNNAVIGCTVPTGTSLVVSMRVPGAAIPEVSFFSPTRTNLGNVVRCGPPVVCTIGTAFAINTTATNPSTYLVASRARLAVSTSLRSTAIRQISYSITVQNLPELSSTSSSDFAGAVTYSTY